MALHLFFFFVTRLYTSAQQNLNPLHSNLVVTTTFQFSSETYQKVLLTTRKEEKKKKTLLHAQCVCVCVRLPNPNSLGGCFLFLFHGFFIYVTLFVDCKFFGAVDNREKEKREKKMSEVKDPKIKLFGKTIELPETSGEATKTAAPSMIGGVGSVQSCDVAGGDSTLEDSPSSSNSALEDCSLNRDTVSEEQESHKSLSGPKLDDVNVEDHGQPLTSGELKDCDATPPMNEDLQAPSTDSDAGAGKTSKTEEDQSETSNSPEKTLKKPDKILPCPRCNSMDTKFCYFNNYNVNQPRHFCKNCQRYWTAGGTMRNVPVGAGRRKNKNAACQFHHLTVQEALQSARVELSNGIHHPSLNPNGTVGTVLAFSSDSPQPLCESMASVLNIADKTIRNSSRNGFNNPEELRSPVSHGVIHNSDNPSSGTSTTTTSLKDEVGKTVLPEAMVPNCHTFPQIPCFPGPPWPYPWNSVPWSSPLSPPTFGAACFPLPIYATAPPYWGCAVPGTWNFPWVITPTASKNHTPPSSGPNSPTLGKHSRDDNIVKPVDGKLTEMQKDSNSEKSLWVPKTLRIDDMGEAAKSSIWATLGIKNDTADSVGGGGLFKALSKGDEKTHIAETSSVLQANPAALSRSLSFHESS